MGRRGPLGETVKEGEDGDAVAKNVAAGTLQLGVELGKSVLLDNDNINNYQDFGF